MSDAAPAGGADALIRSLRALVAKWRVLTEVRTSPPGLSASLVSQMTREGCADDLAAVLDRPVPQARLTDAYLTTGTSYAVADRPAQPPKGLFLTDAQIKQVMNALEGWDGKDSANDEADRKVAFEMIQDLGDRPAPPQEEPTLCCSGGKLDLRRFSNCQIHGQRFYEAVRPAPEPDK